MKRSGFSPVLRGSMLFVLLLLPAVAASTDLNGDEMVRLQRGEILLQTIHDDRPGGAARVTAMFHSNAQAVWDIIGYCKYELIYMRGLSFCEMLEGDQFQMKMHHRLHNSWYMPTLDFTFEASRDSDDYGEARLIEGDLDVLEGSWRFTPTGEGNSLIVVHEVRIKPGIPAPRWLVRRSLRKDLPDMLACIRGLARASQDNSHLEKDLERCPGDISGLSK